MLGLSAGAALLLAGGVGLAVGSMGSDSPDTSGMNQAAADQAALSREQLAWSKQIYAETAPDRAAANKRSGDISDAQLRMMNKQEALTDDYADYQKTTFRPLEKGLVSSAQEYDTEARREAKADQAMGGVQAQGDATMAQQRRNLGRMGVNPSANQSVVAGNQAALNMASQKAAVAMGARDSVETQGYARKMDAANLGRNLSSNQATSAQIATQQGDAAVRNQNSALAAQTSGADIMQAGFTGASNTMNSAGGIYNNIASIDQKAGDNSAAWGAFGTIAGSIFGQPAVGAAIGKRLGGG